MSEKKIAKYKLKIWDDVPVFEKIEDDIYRIDEKNKTENHHEDSVDFFA